jgi:hypothetical protein
MKLTHTSFHVETDGGNCGHNLTELELVQDGSFTYKHVSSRAPHVQNDTFIPAASSPTIKIRISFFPKSLANNFPNDKPMAVEYV